MIPLAAPLPPWSPIGVEIGPGAEWFYVFRGAAGQMIRFNQRHMLQASTLLALDGDADRWRTMFPHPRAQVKIDLLKAAGFLMRECWAEQIRRDQAAKAEEQEGRQGL